MEFLTLAVCMLALLVCTKAQGDPTTPCFDFQGDSYLRFSLGNFDNNNNIHYSFHFKTSTDNGIIMYAKGHFGDDEAIFVRNGRLCYHLFNMSPTGVEGYFGGYYETDVPVDTNEWVKVDMYRNWRVMDHGNRRVRNQTGIIVHINNEKYEHVDYENRGDVSIDADVFFGGYREPLSESVGYFNGLLTNIREEKNNRLFEYPTLNYLSRVGLGCFGQVMPN